MPFNFGVDQSIANRAAYRVWRAQQNAEFGIKLPRTLEGYTRAAQSSERRYRRNAALGKYEKYLIDDGPYQGYRQKGQGAMRKGWTGRKRRRSIKGRGSYTWHNFKRDAGHFRLAQVLGKQGARYAGAVAKAGVDSALESRGITPPGQQPAYGPPQYAGRGDYTVNSLIKGSSYKAMNFSSMTDEQGDMICTHSEYVRDIHGNPTDSTFEVQTLNINPGLEATFPWLSQIAQNFDEYVMIQLVFEFRSTLTDVISDNNGQVGQVVMVTNYNVDKPAFAQKHLMMQYNGAQSAKSTLSAIHGVECDPTKLSGAEGKRIRTKPLATGNLMDYDHAKFMLAVSATPDGIANETIGELWVTYKVLLRKPKFYTSMGFGISCDEFLGHADGTQGGNGISGTDPFGTMYDGTAGRPLMGKNNSIGIHCSAVQSDATASNPTLANWALWNYDSTGTADSQLTTTLTDIDAILVNADNGSGDIYGCWIRLVFPSYSSGNYEITIHTEANTDALDETPFDRSKTAIAVCGNVHPIFDMVTGGYPKAASGSSFIRRSDVRSDAKSGPREGVDSSAKAIGLIVVVHVHVEIPAKGADNAVYIPLASPTNATTAQGWDQTAVKVSEYASNRDLEAPKFVNAENVEQETHVQYTANTVNDNVTEANDNGPAHTGRRLVVTSS